VLEVLGRIQDRLPLEVLVAIRDRLVVLIRDRLAVQEVALMADEDANNVLTFQ
jgi:hypothetical protein